MDKWRVNQEISRYLQTCCADNQTDWDRYLPWVEYAQNSLKHSANTGAPSIDEWFKKSEQVWENAHQHLERVTEERKQYADRRHSNAPQYKPGESHSE